MNVKSKEIERLIHDEGLDDLDRLLVPREWDEVPFVSRLDRLAFLAGVDLLERSRILVVSAVEHLDRILAFVEDTKRHDVVVMVSITDWEDLTSVDPDPVIPNFWISTNPKRDLASFRLRSASSKESALVKEWLGSAGLLQNHEIFDSAEPVADPELRRVYVARLGDPQVTQLIEP